MGQKANPASLRIGTKTGWGTEFNGKKARDVGVVHQQGNSLTNFTNRFFEIKGFSVQQLKLYFNENALTVYLSISSKIKKDVPAKKKKVEEEPKKYFLKKSLRGLKTVFVAHKKIHSSVLTALVKVIGEKFFNKKKVTLLINYSNKHLNFTRRGRKELKRDFMSLRRFKRQNFFKPALENVVALSKNPSFLNSFASYVSGQLKTVKGAGGFLRFLKNSLKKTSRNPEYPLSGIKIKLSGRLSKSNRSRTKFLTAGAVPCQSFKTPLNYFSGTVKTRNGSLGLKIWTVGK